MQTRLDRAKLRKLADQYARDARILLANRAWSSAYYLCGYSVECALKACIAKQIRRYEFPDLEAVKNSYTHDLKKLLKLAGLTAALETRSQRADQFGKYWVQVVTKWNETSRYEKPTRVMAEELVRAVSDTKEGILPWIKLHR